MKKLVPPAFWANFTHPEDAIAEHREGPLRIRRLFADRQTLEDWEKGEFAVWHHDGRHTHLTNLEFDREEIMRAFPPKKPA